jgi:trk system potassium uptake protein TrkH
MYVGEGKDERLLPNVIQTARAIWLVSLVYLGAGTLALWVTSIFLGQGPVRGFLHALWIFMSGWATAGYAPQSYNTLYYHSLTYEMITLVICVAGTINFALHWAVWTGNRSEIRKNIEIASMFVTMTAGMLVTAAGLMKLGVYPDTMAVFRKMTYQVISGHTGTGYATVYARTFVRQWGPLAMLGVTMAMAVGGSACSTAGGIKGMRMGIIFKSFVETVRRILNPESARVVEKWHHLTDRVLDDATVRSAMLISLAYLASYGAGAFVGASYGYDLTDSLFESVSAAANVGLSCGVTHPSMPDAIKVTYMLQMWAGRLEFLSLFALAGYVVAFIQGR